MTTSVAIKAEGPKDAVVDLMNCNPADPKEAPQIAEVALIQVGTEREFVVYDSRYLVVRERV